MDTFQGKNSENISVKKEAVGVISKKNNDWLLFGFEFYTCANESTAVGFRCIITVDYKFSGLRPKYFLSEAMGIK